MRLDFQLPAPQLAPQLLGAVLSVSDDEGTVAVRLTEVEAYDGAQDPGSHAYRGRTARTAPMFCTGPRLYVYFTYGMHWCANLVCGAEGSASAVLLRGAEVVAGLEVARRRRPTARSDRELAQGPARLAKAVGLDGKDSGLELVPGARAQIGPPSQPAEDYATGPRTGVSGEGGDGALFPWRFWLPGEPTVSTYRPAAPRRKPRRQPSTGQT